MTLALPHRIALFTLALVAAGCGPRPHYAEGVYRDAATAYRIEEPAEGFERRGDVALPSLAWEGPRGASILVDARCDRALDIPLAALMRHLVIGMTEISLVEERLLPMDGREALERHLLAKVDGVERELVLRVLKKDGCVYDFALVAAPGSPFEAARPGYARVVGSFETR